MGRVLIMPHRQSGVEFRPWCAESIVTNSGLSGPNNHGSSNTWRGAKYLESAPGKARNTIEKMHIFKAVARGAFLSQYRHKRHTNPNLWRSAKDLKNQDCSTTSCSNGVWISS